MSNWQFEAKVSQGNCVIYIGLDPDDLLTLATEDDPSKYLWKVTGTESETSTLTIRQTDSDFHLGVAYFVYMVNTNVNEQGDAASTILKLEVRQERHVSFLGNFNDASWKMQHPLFNRWTSPQKFVFETTKELVKFHTFQV